VVWRYDATSEDAKAQLTADRHIYRDGDVEYQGTEVANEISLRYRYNARFAKLRAQVTVTGDPNKNTGDFLWRNSYAETSRSRYGTKPLDLETELVSSRATAGRIVNWMSRAYSAKHRTISYRAPYKLAYLQIGDIVSITDSELYFDDQVVLIQAIDWGEEDLVFTFLLIPDLPRDTIPTG
jgi:predicted phage tail protein